MVEFVCMSILKLIEWVIFFKSLKGFYQTWLNNIVEMWPQGWGEGNGGFMIDWTCRWQGEESGVIPRFFVRVTRRRVVANWDRKLDDEFSFVFEDFVSSWVRSVSKCGGSKLEKKVLVRKWNIGVKLSDKELLQVSVWVAEGQQRWRSVKLSMTRNSEALWLNESSVWIVKWFKMLECEEERLLWPRCSEYRWFIGRVVDPRWEG